MNDDALKAAYRRLLAERAVRPPPDIELDVLQAAAEGSVHDAEREAIIDRALSHPETAKEYAFLAELARARRPRTVQRHWLAVAAALVGVFATGLFMMRSSPTPLPETLRGDASTPVLLEPEAGARLGRGTRFVWSTFPTATAYRIEIVDDRGVVMGDAVTRDTMWVLDSVAGLESGTPLLWWVTAELAGGDERRTEPRRATAR